MAVKRFSFANTGLVRAEARGVRSSTRKVRLVLEGIRGQSVVDARAQLMFSPRDAARDVELVLRSAVTNAEVNHGLSADDLVVHEAFADEGVTMKRFKPRARGRASRIRKRTSHITILLRSGSGQVIEPGVTGQAGTTKSSDSSRASRVAASKKADGLVEKTVVTDAAEDVAVSKPRKAKTEVTAADATTPKPRKAKLEKGGAAVDEPAAKKPAVKKDVAAAGDAVEKKPAAPRKRAPKKIDTPDGEKD